MRTTIEITDDRRARLLQLAAKRGEKGFSKIVGEALDQYFEHSGDRDELRQQALDVIGTLDSDSADRLESEVRKLRESWR